MIKEVNTVKPGYSDITLCDTSSIASKQLTGMSISRTSDKFNKFNVRYVNNTNCLTARCCVPFSNGQLIKKSCVDSNK